MYYILIKLRNVINDVINEIIRVDTAAYPWRVFEPEGVAHTGWAAGTGHLSA